MLSVYGIPTCSTVKKAQSWLTQRGLAFTAVDLRATPPERARIERWVRAFGVRALKNTSGGSYRALPADKESWTDAAWIDAFAADPMLVKRPVIERDGAPVLVGFTATEAEITAKLGI